LDLKIRPICAIQRADTREAACVFNSFREIKETYPHVDLGPLIESYQSTNHEESPFADTFDGMLWINEALLAEDWNNLCRCVPEIDTATREYGSENPVVMENRSTGERTFFVSIYELLPLFPSLFPDGDPAKNKASIRNKFTSQRSRQKRCDSPLTPYAMLQFDEKEVTYYLSYETLLLDGSLTFPVDDITRRFGTGKISAVFDNNGRVYESVEVAAESIGVELTELDIALALGVGSCALNGRRLFCKSYLNQYISEAIQGGRGTCCFIFDLVTPYVTNASYFPPL
jgi:hypothetical protein